MKKLRINWRSALPREVCLALLAVLITPAAAAPGPPVLTNAAQVLSLPAQMANLGREARVRGMVTFHSASQGLLFVQDRSGGVYVSTDAPVLRLKIGEWVEVRGVTAPGRVARIIARASVSRIDNGGAVPPKAVSLASLADGREDSQFVVVAGVVQSAERTSDNTLRLTVSEGGRNCAVIMPDYPAGSPVAELVDEGLTVTGVCVQQPSSEGKPERPAIWARTPADLAGATPAPAEETLSVSQIARLVADGPARATAHRVRLRGSITHVENGEAYLQDGSGALLLRPETPLKEGDRIEVTGFLDWKNGLPSLLYPQVRSDSPGEPPRPIGISASVLNSGKLPYGLARLSATVVHHARKGDSDELICRDAEDIFTAELRGAPADALAAIQPESEVQLTGLVVPQVVAGEPGTTSKLLLRSPADVVIVHPRPWWTTQTAGAALAASLAALFAAGVWLALLRRRVRTQGELINVQFEKGTVLEAQYRDLVQNASDIVYTHDLEGNISGANESGHRLLGYRTDELMGMNLSRILPPESLQTVRSKLEQKIKEGGRTTYELKVMDKFGRLLDLEVSSWLVSREGRPVSVQGIARDISARRLAERALREGEQKYRDVVETSQDLIWSVDARGRWTFVNRAALRIYGFDPEQLRGHPVAELEAENNPVSIEGLLANLEGRETLKFESGHKRKDGSQVFLSFQAIVVRDAKGDLLGLQGSARDITQQKRDQENILRLAAAVEQATEIVAILDTTGVVQYVNPSFERLTGFRAREALERGFGLLLEEGPENPSFLEIADTISRTGFWSGRLRARKSGRGFFAAEATISTIRDEQNKVINYACLLRDVSREAHLEEQVRLSQKMEAIGLLAGGVAHDFNNLLQVIDGYAGLALGSLGAVEECRENLERVLAATLRATQLTRQLLAFGRQQTLQTVDTDLNTLVSEHLDMVRRLIGAHIEVEFFPEPAIENVRADRGQMEQVLLNLCINARDAMPRGGRLTVDLRNEILAASKIPPGAEIRPGSCVRLSVRDTGTGMDKSTLSKIFDPFFTTKAKGKGTGLGLSVVYGIIKQHGGLIHVESEPGAGSEFQIYLSAVERTAGSAPVEPGQLDSTGDETILLAEDEPLVRDISSKVLIAAGYKVVAVENGREAVELFEKAPRDFDLLVFDVLMPQCGGSTAYLRAKSIRPGIPVLLCTGYGGSDPLLDQLAEAGVEILNKPFSSQRLLQRVRHTLDHFSAPEGLDELAVESAPNFKKTEGA